MSVLAWHFTSERKLANTGEPIVLGEWHEIAPPIELCQRGLHGSRRAIDALRYAPGAMSWRVEHDGEILEEEDKLCSSRRRAVAFAPIDLRRFARLCALSVAHLRQDPKIVTKWLKCGDESLRGAAWGAARGAAGAAAGGAAWEAAWGAARAAAWEAARAAAWDAAWGAQNTILERTLLASIEGLRLPLEIAQDEIDELRGLMFKKEGSVA